MSYCINNKKRHNICEGEQLIFLEHIKKCSKKSYLKQWIKGALVYFTKNKKESVNYTNCFFAKYKYPITISKCFNHFSVVTPQGREAFRHLKATTLLLHLWR